MCMKHFVLFQPWMKLHTGKASIASATRTAAPEVEGGSIFNLRPSIRLRQDNHHHHCHQETTPKEAAPDTIKRGLMPPESRSSFFRFNFFSSFFVKRAIYTAIYELCTQYSSMCFGAAVHLQSEKTSVIQRIT